ncbi:hypothetical protein VP249E411_P0126 [Vibrio phage 249E41-1]|nr:hypothetical protein VP249E411_P0126 [Vibrio phage 249E41-1]CAH9017080.1 hypothetical protein VP193E371_P0124 [Vibrio phage 193E37-1]
MRLFVYEECQGMVQTLSESCNLTPTKYINNLLKILHEECHTELTEEVNDRVKRLNRGRNRTDKS